MTTQLWLYEHEDGRHIAAPAGAAILAGDPHWVRVGPVEVPDVDALRAELQYIADADPSQWYEDMRDQFQQWAQSRARTALASTKKDAPAVPDAEAVMDAKRLDWCEKNLVCVNQDMAELFCIAYIDGDGVECSTGRVFTLRDAIDAAMSAAPPATDDGATS